VTAVPDPAAALDIAAERPGAFRLLLSDVVMPGMSGPVMASRLTAAQPDLAVLFISANPRMDVEGRLLAKPVPADELEAAARDALVAVGTPAVAAVR
jgi:CheY-like chemotaxis protein